MESETAVLRRMVDGRIEPPEGYVEYDGQVIIRTRWATIQRFKNSGWDRRGTNAVPYLLTEHHCDGEEGDDPMNPELEKGQVSVKYVKTGEKTVYEVR